MRRDIRHHPASDRRELKHAVRPYRLDHEPNLIGMAVKLHERKRRVPPVLKIVVEEGIPIALAKPCRMLLYNLKDLILES